MSISITFSHDKREKPNREKGNNLIALPKDYTVIDIETTGLDPYLDEIIEIGAIKVIDSKVIKEYSSLVKPEHKISDFITELTGITNEMLSTAPKIETVLPSFMEFIGNDILLGHNIHFDINFIYDYMIDLFEKKLSNDFVDLMRLSRKVYPEFTNHKLSTVSNNLKINNYGSHRSVADCLTTHECFQILSSKMDNDEAKLKSLWYNNYSIILKNLIPKSSDFDTDHIFFNKNCTFTGKLEKMTREEAAQLVVNIGGKCLNGVTKQSNFLILGTFDYTMNIKGDKSSKLKKAEEYILKGQDLKILSENVFYDLILDN